MAAEQEGPDLQENVFMLRVIPWDSVEEKDDGLAWLIVTMNWYPGRSWNNLMEAMNNEIQGAINEADLVIPCENGRWELDMSDVWVLWCDPADWWTDMTRMTERNCDALMDMMRERQHKDALSVKIKFQN